MLPLTFFFPFLFLNWNIIALGFPGGSMVKNPPAGVGDTGDVGSIHGENGNSSILVWEIPWTEEPGGLQSMGLQRVGHDLVTKQQQNKTKQKVK